jgi:hypothetical protein
MDVLKREALPEPIGKFSSNGKYPESSIGGESHDVGNPYRRDKSGPYARPQGLSADPQALENRQGALEQFLAFFFVAGLLASLQEQAVGFLSAGVLHLVIKGQ